MAAQGKDRPTIGATKDPKPEKVFEDLATLRKRLATTERDLAEAEACLGQDFQALASGGPMVGQERALLVSLQLDRRVLLSGIAAAERELAASRERERMVGVMQEREKLEQLIRMQQEAAVQLDAALDALSGSIKLLQGSGDAVLGSLAGAEENTLTAAGWETGHPVAQLRERTWLHTLLNANLARRLGAAWPYERSSIYQVDIVEEIRAVGLSALLQFDRKHRSQGLPQPVSSALPAEAKQSPEVGKALIQAAKAEVAAENAKVARERLASIAGEESAS